MEYYPISFFYQSGNIHSGYACFYDFIISEIVKPDSKTLEIWDIFKTVTEELHYFFVFKDFVFISEKPKILKFQSTQLHNENGKAVEYMDGYGLYALNGVSVPEWLITTPAEKIDCKKILTEKNAEVRREIVRKVGVERLILKLGAKTLDKTDNGMYELLDINLGDGRIRPYLKMRNPSINTFHVEGVPPGTATVAQALEWRNQSTESPIQLS